MKVAFTHNLRLTDRLADKERDRYDGAKLGDKFVDRDAEFDSVETINAIVTAIEAAGHEVEKVEVSGPASALLERLESIDPDIVFNIAAGQGGRLREALYPALFDELGLPYTGSDAHTSALAVDKWVTKLMVGRAGIDTPRATLVTPRNYDQIVERGPGLAFPVIVKPNFELGESGSHAAVVVRELRDLPSALRSAVRAFPDGVLIEEYIEGIDVVVGYIDGIGHDNGLLMPVELLVEASPDAAGARGLFDGKQKATEPAKVQYRCPANIPRDVAARLRQLSSEVIRTLNIRDVARLDFRISSDGRIYLLEVDAAPLLAPSSSLFAATAQIGLSYQASVAAILNAGAVRSGLATASQLGGRRGTRAAPIRVGFTYNVKRSHDGDDEAEWDPPETIISIANALARQGHIVVHLEATPDLPRVLAEADVDLIFNIAEGVEGRNREAQVPALCELLGIPYTGSDSATLAIALDKALAKKVLLQHDILTPKFQLMESPRERLSPDMTFPLIVKPNAEGSSKGIGATSVVDTEEELRAAVKECVDRYRQPALVEEYIKGREFTVGLLGDKRPRVLPPMEICFKNVEVERPVYDYGVKQEWEKHVSYECPAKVSDAELKAIEKIARATYWALDCRDVARVDLRMDQEGRIYVLEVNPLPGLTPDYSDLVLISKAVGISYDDLIAEIMTGGLRRLRDKRREERELEREREAAAAAAKSAVSITKDQVARGDAGLGRDGDKGGDKRRTKPEVSAGGAATVRGVRTATGSDRMPAPGPTTAASVAPATAHPSVGDDLTSVTATVTSSSTH